MTDLVVKSAAGKVGALKIALSEFDAKTVGTGKIGQRESASLKARITQVGEVKVTAFYGAGFDEMTRFEAGISQVGVAKIALVEVATSKMAVAQVLARKVLLRKNFVDKIHTYSSNKPPAP